jgi:NADPH-dependent 2,4-dienoyl-CoA reductase/sulfur reductase-like enzyme
MSMRTVRFSFDGKSVTAREGQSLAAALLDAGVVTLTRSSKYRRPRGLYCANGHCPNCMLRVDGQPHVRTCMTPARDNHVVESEGAAARRIDPFRAIDRTGSLFPVGFQYQYFKRQNLAWRVWEGRLRALAAESELPEPFEIPPAEWIEADLLVAGGGPAGLAAALAAAERGLEVVLATRRPLTGRGSDSAETRQLRALVSAQPKIRVLAPGTVIAGFGDRYVVDCRHQVTEVTAERSVLATGAYERGLSFPGNDRPGVMLTSALLRLVLDDGVTPKGAIAIITDQDWAYNVAARLIAAGCEIAAVIDVRRGGPGMLRSEPDTQVLTEAEILSVYGGARSVRGLSVRTAQGVQKLRCGSIAMSGGWQPADELRYAATSQGDAVVIGERATTIGGGPGPAARALPTLQAVGSVAGCSDPGAAATEGKLAGTWAAEGRYGR